MVWELLFASLVLFPGLVFVGDRVLLHMSFGTTWAVV